MAAKFRMAWTSLTSLGWVSLLRRQVRARGRGHYEDPAVLLLCLTFSLLVWSEAGARQVWSCHANAAIPWCSFLKAIIIINYNDTERDEERKEIALIWTPQKGNRGYWDLRVPYRLGPTASGFFFIWAVRILPQTVRNLPHTITDETLGFTRKHSE